MHRQNNRVGQIGPDQINDRSLGDELTAALQILRAFVPCKWLHIAPMDNDINAKRLSVPLCPASTRYDGDAFIGIAIAALALQAEKRTSSKKYGPRGAGWVHRVRVQLEREEKKGIILMGEGDRNTDRTYTLPCMSNSAIRTVCHCVAMLQLEISTRSQGVPLLQSPFDEITWWLDNLSTSHPDLSMISIPSPPFPILVREASPYKIGSLPVHQLSHTKMIYHVVCLHQKGQFSLSAPSTDIDAVKATTVARTKERRIFCESSKTPFYAPSNDLHDNDVCNASRSPPTIYPKEQGSELEDTCAKDLKEDENDDSEVDHETGKTRHQSSYVSEMLIKCLASDGVA
ncbi:hypothetical protein C8R48DRAFT_671708 [Suillus tomentosus]|nr:hypothetical protein C8R48DRAFT_671708 [Suillus tomentosus]